MTDTIGGVDQLRSTMATRGAEGEALARGTPAGGDRSRKRKLGIGFWMSAGWVTLVLLWAVLGNAFPGTQDPTKPDPCAPFVAKRVDLGLDNGLGTTSTKAGCTVASRAGAGPSTKHLLGLDLSARDNLARIVSGARVAMVVGVVTIAIAMLIGGSIGLIAGYFGGKIETFMMAAVDIMLAFPTLVLALAIVAILGQGLSTTMIAITVVAVPAMARIARASTLTYARREFVTAARLMGAKNSRIIVREILPNVIFPLLAFALIAIAVAIVAEGALAFLSLSVKDPQPSWGQMITDGRPGLLRGQPAASLIPAGVMFLTVLSFNLLGDKFRQIFNVREAAL
ncbi:MAG: ABC transporter permease [Actinobacteria bacterium]|nr:ABC transporter permease [Actinomycetota bacterium]